MKKLISQTQKILKKYDMIQENDKIAVGISGGKDSLALLHALSVLQRYYKPNFSVCAIYIDNYSGKQNYQSIIDFCNEINVELFVVTTDISEVVFDVRNEKNPCSLCAKMRRGALCDKCNSLGINKLALGHHLNDVVDTFFMSMTQEGRLSTMQPTTYLSKTNITMIRPMFEIFEEDIKRATKTFTIHKNKCQMDKNSNRTDINNQVRTFAKQFKGGYKLIAKAIISKDRYNLIK